MKNSGNQQDTLTPESGLYNSEPRSGNAVLLLAAAAKGSLADRLAENFRVVTLEPRDSNDQQSVVHAIRRKADQLGIAKYFLIADSELAPAAIEHAIGSGDSVEGLILMAPKDTSDGAAIDLPLEQLTAPTLVLFGTRDEAVAPETGRVYARRIPTCFYTLVYDAGHDIGADRPQALYAIVRDFLEHREKFIIPHESSAINP